MQVCVASWRALAIRKRRIFPAPLALTLAVRGALDRIATSGRTRRFMVKIVSTLRGSCRLRAQVPAVLAPGRYLARIVGYLRLNVSLKLASQRVKLREGEP